MPVLNLKYLTAGSLFDWISISQNHDQIFTRNIPAMTGFNTIKLHGAGE
jgi:hypothetical protein